MSQPFKALDEVAEVIGFTATMHLVFWFGSVDRGTNLHVPTNWSAEHPIAQAIGQEPFRALVRYYGGTAITISDSLVDLRISRYKRVLEMDQGGGSHEAIAEAVGMSVRRVQQLLRSLRTTRLDRMLVEKREFDPGGVLQENANSTPGGVL